MRVLVTGLPIFVLLMTACSHAPGLEKNTGQSVSSIAEYVASHSPAFDKSTRKWSYRQAERSIEGKSFKEGRVLKVETYGSTDSKIRMWYTPCMAFESVKQSLKDFGFEIDARPAFSSHDGYTTRYYAVKESQSHMERVAIELDPSRKTSCVANIYL